ncbi:torsin-1A-interacting protein 2-like isoform X3 [Sardina pilchardus]|uniref:torsin-1A-interacting protein 2-like isoform X3 n=1 Tax=Sardina pilchardus TaxID=27697 RepID=UPI002E163DE2
MDSSHSVEGLDAGKDGESTEKESQDHRSSTEVKSTPSDVDSAAEDLRQMESDRAEENKAGEGGDEANTAGADVVALRPDSGDQEGLATEALHDLTATFLTSLPETVGAETVREDGEETHSVSAGQGAGGDMVVVLDGKAPNTNEQQTSAGEDGESTEKESQDHRSSTAVKSTPSAAEDLRQTESDRAEENKAGEGGDEANTAGADVAALRPDSGDQEGLATEALHDLTATFLTSLPETVGAETVREDGEETHSVSAGQGAGGDMVVVLDGKAPNTNEQQTSAGEDGESTEKESQDHRSSTAVKSTPSAEDLRQTESDRAEENKAGEGGDEANTAGANVAALRPDSGDQEGLATEADAEIQSEDASDKTKTKTETPPAEAAPTAGCDTGDTGSRSKKPKEHEGITQTTEVEETEQRAPPTLNNQQSTQHLPVGLAIGAVLLLVFAVFVPCLWPAPEPEKPNLDKVEVFREEMAKVERSFRNQRSELWRRSRIHLQRHLKSAKPSEPVSLILVGGRKAERTLKCLAAHLAKAFSSSLNGSVLQVDGSSLANMDHDQVKLDLDNQLKDAFEGDKPAAVIHRLEELPPSSTLIFYRYCDHENAAYKDPLLAFTVLLPQDAVDPEFSISQVEEMAHSHLHDKYLTSDQPDTFDRMDVDKLSGLWSRISHLILPVNVEEHMEKGGCDWE